jgi:L-ribulose-5-phosphate 3-epimerase
VKTSPTIAVCSWSLRPEGPAELLAALDALGLRAVQLALSPLLNDPSRWGRAVEHIRAAGVEIVSGMMAMAGEDYSTLESIARTGGLRPHAAWLANRDHAAAIARLAADLGIGLVSFHAGFLPHDPADPERPPLLARLAEIADLFGEHGLELALETGQETAATLSSVLRELDRTNVGVNFDPANMILYGIGDPVAALRTLAPHVVQIHIKDALRSSTRGQWGKEVPVGEGEVDWPAFFAALASVPRQVCCVIEREAGNNRKADVARAKALIKTLAAQSAPSA